MKASSMRTLEEAVARFLKDYETVKRVPGFSRKVPDMGAVDSLVPQLEAAYTNHMGTTEGPPRGGYSAEPADSPGERGIKETHESYGMIGISRVAGWSRLFGSHVRHQHFFSMTIRRASRMSSGFGERFFATGRMPIIEVKLSPAQFVELITSMNQGDGVPCTIDSVDGIRMESVPESDSEVARISDSFKDEVREVVTTIRESQKGLEEILAKPTISKKDREVIREAHHRALRLLTDSTPFVAKMVQEGVEKLVAKGKLEVEAFLSLAIQRAGIKAIKDSGGNLLFGPDAASDRPHEDEESGFPK